MGVTFSRGVWLSWTGSELCQVSLVWICRGRTLSRGWDLIKNLDFCWSHSFKRWDTYQQGLHQLPCDLPGTRIIYDRKFLMECRNSPVAKTPPRDLPTIPGVTSPPSDEPSVEVSHSHLRSSPEDKPASGE